MIHRPFLAAAAALAASCAAPVGAWGAEDGPRVYPSPEYAVSESGYGLGVSIDETTVFARIDPPDGPVFWTAERRRQSRYLVSGPWVVDHQWIDGRACPALLPTLESVAGLPAMRFRSPAGSPTPPPFHSDRVTLWAAPEGGGQGPAASIKLTVYMGPLIEWWGAAKRALDACWSPTQPRFGDQLLSSYLYTDNWKDAWR